MQREVHFKQNISTIVCLQKICEDDISDIKITSHYYIQKSTIIYLYHANCQIIDNIILCVFIFPICLCQRSWSIFQYIILYVFIFPICLCQHSRSIQRYMYRDWTASFSIRFRDGTCIIILDKKYNIANSSCHFGSYGSI